MELKPLAVPFLVPMFVVFIVVLAIALALISWKRKKESQHRYSSTFLPPIIAGENIPKELTYIVSRSWKPPTPRDEGVVYAPLSIPIETLPSKSLFGRGVMSQALAPQPFRDQSIV